MRLVGACSLIAISILGCGDSAQSTDARDVVDALEVDGRLDVAPADATDTRAPESDASDAPDDAPDDTIDVSDELKDLHEIDDVDDIADARAEIEDSASEIDADLSTCGTTTNDDRYLDFIDLSGDPLRDALHEFVSDAALGYSYDAGRNLMWGITDDIDVDADLQIECVYTGVHVPADGTRSPGEDDLDMSTEHSWPRGDGADIFPAEGDVHHLFPVLSTANNARASYAFGDTICGHADQPTCRWSQGGSHLGTSTDGRNPVFEVRPERRGDIARAHFYFAVRYAFAIPIDEEATLRRWHCEDPPDAIERTRNDEIERHQRNRNPFIDQPQLVERLSDY